MLSTQNITNGRTCQTNLKLVSNRIDARINGDVFSSTTTSDYSASEGEWLKLSYTKYNSIVSDGLKCVNASFKIDKLNHKMIEKEKLKVYFLTLPETDRRIKVKKHSENVAKFLRIAKKKFGIKATARAKEHSSTRQIHSHFIIISEKEMTKEASQIWQKISGVAIAEYEEMYYFPGLRQYVCKKNQKNEEKISEQEKIRQKFSFSRKFKDYLTEQQITINNGYRNIATIIFSNESVKVKLLKTSKSKMIDGKFAEYLQPFKETLKFRTNDIYGFTALNEKNNFISFFGLKEILSKEPEKLYFMSINGQFRIVDRFEYFENKLIG